MLEKPNWASLFSSSAKSKPWWLVSVLDKISDENLSILPNVDGKTWQELHPDQAYDEEPD